MIFSPIRYSVAEFSQWQLGNYDQTWAWFMSAFHCADNDAKRRQTTPVQFKLCRILNLANARSITVPALRCRRRVHHLQSKISQSSCIRGITFKGQSCDVCLRLRHCCNLREVSQFPFIYGGVSKEWVLRRK